MHQQLKAKVLIGAAGVVGAAIAAVLIGGTVGRDVANIIMIGTVVMVILS